MAFARTFSFTGLLLLALLVYGGIASAQTTSYIPGITSGTNSTNASGSNTGMNSSTNGTSSSSGTTSSRSVLGASTSNPNLPNTGAGGSAGGTLVALLASGLAAVGGIFLLRRRGTI